MVADLLTNWSWDPSVVGGVAMLALAYGLIPSRQSDGSPRDRFGRRLCFAAGEVVLLLALVSPLDSLADHRSLLAHMIQHLLLLLVVPTLFLGSIPDSFFRRLRQPRSDAVSGNPSHPGPLSPCQERAGAGRSGRDREQNDPLSSLPFAGEGEGEVSHNAPGLSPERVDSRAPRRTRSLVAFARPLATPGVTFCVATGVLWFWHAPSLYEAALRSETIHALEHLSFLVSATLFWWPVLRPATHPAPLPELLRIVYLFAAAVSSTLLSALITFSTTVLYPTYLGVTPWLGLSPLDDQQIGGLLMWVVMGLWTFGVAAITFIRWFDRPTVDDEPGSRLEPEGALP